MLPETKEEFMVEVLGNLLSVGRGLHIQPEEKDSSNLKNDNISRAYLLNYDDIKNYSYYLSNMLDVKIDKKTEVYVNLDKRYKNSIPKNFDIVIPQRSYYFEPRLLYFKGKQEHKYIYSNDVIFLRSISDKIDIRYIFHLLNTQKVRNIINNVEDKKSRRIRIENIKFDLPDIRTQRKIVTQLEKTQMKFEDLIK